MPYNGNCCEKYPLNGIVIASLRGYLCHLDTNSKNYSCKFKPCLMRKVLKFLGAYLVFQQLFFMMVAYFFLEVSQRDSSMAYYWALINVCLCVIFILCWAVVKKIKM